MRAKYSILAAALAAVGSATNLYVASYAGTVTTLSLSTTDNKTYSLTNTSVSTGCGGSPSWLELDRANDLLYCIDEGNVTPNGSLNTLKTSRNGTLTPIMHQDTITGPVSSIFFNSGNKSAVALAHYSGHAVSTWLRSPTGQLSAIENMTFTLATPGPNAARQSAAYEHEAIIDPTGKYLLFPDLGSDLIRVYSFDSSTNALSAHDSIKAAPGSGPRHGVFWSPWKRDYGSGTPVFLFVIHELDNTITSYSVTYPKGNSTGLSFREVQTVKTFGNMTLPAGAAAAEILASPDKHYIISSSRNDTAFNITNPDPKNSTSIQSDSLSVWRPTPSGNLEFLQLAPAGGSFPRHFSTNKAGTLVSVALQMTSQVVIYRRDVQTGRLGDLVASANIDGQLTNVIWDE